MVFLQVGCILKNLVLNNRLGILTLLKSMNTSMIPWEVNLDSFSLRSGEGNGTPLQYCCLENPKEPGGLQFMGSLESNTTERIQFHFSLSCIGEGNGNPLQCSCLENPRDGGAWWAAVYGVAQSRTRLK